MDCDEVAMLEPTFRRISSSQAFGAVAIFVAALTTLLPFASAAGPKNGPVWIQKDWTHWTFIDCDSVLNSSPWAESNESGAGSFTMEGAIQFTSALPIEQATIRKAQIWAGYDRMGPSKKQAFDQIHPDRPDDSDARPISIYVANGVAINGNGLYSWIPQPFPGGQAVLKLSDGTVLFPTAISGQIREHGNFILYSFPRIVKGKPAYTDHDKTIEIFFRGSLWVDKHGNVVPHDQQAFPLDPKDEVKFPIAPMIYKGKLEY